MRLPWQRRRTTAGRIREAQDAADQTRHQARQAREMRLQAETRADAEGRWLSRRLAVSDDMIAMQIERSLRRGR